MFRQLLILVVAVGLAGGVAFGAGVAYGRTATPTGAQAAAAPRAGGASGSPNAPPGAQGTAGAGTPAGQGTARGQGSVPVVGAVARVEGQTLYLTAANGQQVQVGLSDQTRITKQADGSAADLTAGARVTVQPQGQQGADGTLTAAAIAVAPLGAPPTAG